MHYYLYAIANSSVLNGFDVSTKAIDSSSIVSPWQVLFITGGVSALVFAGGILGLYLFLGLNKKKEKTIEEEE